MLGAVCMALTGLRPSLPLVAGSLFVTMLLTPAAQACSQSLWLSKTPQEMMGRVLAIRRMLALSTMPLAALACESRYGAGFLFSSNVNTLVLKF
jgi:hypothetical protein